MAKAKLVEIPSRVTIDDDAVNRMVQQMMDEIKHNQ